MYIKVIFNNVNQPRDEAKTFFDRLGYIFNIALSFSDGWKNSGTKWCEVLQSKVWMRKTRNSLMCKKVLLDIFRVVVEMEAKQFKEKWKLNGSDLGGWICFLSSLSKNIFLMS